jgi:hypothetical protein
MTAGLAHEPIAPLIAQPGALADGLGGEEGVKNSTQHFLLDTRAGIAHPDHKI